jgi:hypothetical protein
VSELFEIGQKKCPFLKRGDTFLQNPLPLTIIENYRQVPEKIIFNL